MKTLKVAELETQIETICELYDKGDDTVYKIELDDGRAVMLTPYNGPYTETVKETDDGEMFVELPQRLLCKLGWKDGDNLNVEVDNGNIVVTKEKASTVELINEPPSGLCELSRDKILLKAHKTIIKCHDNHGRWCYSTREVGLNALEGVVRSPSDAMDRLYSYCFYTFEGMDGERPLADLSFDKFCSILIEK